MAKATDKKKVNLTPEQKAQAKRVAFVRVVTRRVSKAIKAIRLVGSCAGANYSYTGEQVKAIDIALTSALDSVRNAYEKKVVKTEEFSLPS